MNNKRWLIFLIVGFLLIPANLFVPDTAGEVWENEYGRLEVYPDVSMGIITQVQECILTSYIDDAEIDVTFRFDIPVGNPDIWMWRNISHWVSIPDYGMIDADYTLVNISNIIVIDEPEHVDFGDIPSDNYRRGDASFWDNGMLEWINDTFDIGFDSMEWLNPEHTEAKFFYEYWGQTGSHMEEQYWFDWDNIKDLFSHVEHNDKHYYYVRSWMIKDQEYRFKWQYDVPLGSDGKWDLMAKLSSDPLGTWRVSIDPWWDSDWDYYKTIEVADKIEDYQMKLRIGQADDSSGNFNISCEDHCQDDFGDIRFVRESDNSTELPYWIEYIANSENCTIWVNNSYNESKINMYYGTSGTSTTTSDGNTTWDWYEIWTFDDTGKYSTVAGAAGNYGYFDDNEEDVNVPYRQLISWQANQWVEHQYGAGAVHGYANDEVAMYSDDAIHFWLISDTDVSAGATTMAVDFRCRSGASQSTSGWSTFSFVPITGWYVTDIRVGSTSNAVAKVFKEDDDVNIYTSATVTTNIPATVDRSQYISYGNAVAPATETQMWGYDAGAEAVTYGVISDTRGDLEANTKWNCIGKYNLTEPSWSSFGSEQEEQFAPYLSSEYPANESIDIELTPELYVTCTDNNSDTMSAVWYSNSSGDWVSFATNGSISTTDVIRQTNSNFSAYSTEYWWSVNLTDGTLWDNETYHFTTVPPNQAPVLSNENPSNNSVAISVDTDLTITINDPEGNPFNYSWSCSDGSSGSVDSETNGSKTLTLDDDLDTCTVYTWWVNATDGNDSVNESYTFTSLCPSVPADGYVLAWNETLTQLCADIVDAEGDGMEYEIRQDDVVIDSGGTFVYTNHTHNFTNTTDNSAHWESGKSSIPSGLALTSATNFSIVEYENISSVNDSGVNTTGCSPSIWSHHNFSFDLSAYDTHNITNIEVRWYGYAGYSTGGKWYWDATMYIKKGNWGGGVNSTPTPYTGNPVSEWFNYSVDNSFIQSGGTLLVAVENSLAGDCSWVFTDYIEIVITEISGGVGNGTYCTANVSWWNDECGVEWSWVVYVTDGRGTTSTTTYTFNNAPCTFSGTVYPVNEATGVCACCDAICVDVTASYNFNMTIYGRKQGSSIWNVWNKYIDISADEYCFCMEGIESRYIVHAVAHGHTQRDITVINTWYNLTFDDGHTEGMSADPSTGIAIIPTDGMYTATFWVSVHDDSPNPTEKFAVRVILNDTDEVDGSYRELEFSKQSNERHIKSDVHNYFYEGSTVRFQYIGGDTDQHIATHGTWSDDNISSYAYIERLEGGGQFPMEYNTTYEWYVNVSKYDNSSLYNQTSVFSFTTAENLSECVDTASVVGGIRGNYMGIIGLCGLFAIPFSFILYLRLKKRKGYPPSSGNQYRGGYNQNYW